MPLNTKHIVTLKLPVAVKDGKTGTLIRIRVFEGAYLQDDKTSVQFDITGYFAEDGTHYDCNVLDVQVQRANILSWQRPY